MKYLVIMTLLLSLPLTGSSADLADCVNPLLGSDSNRGFSHGNNYPAVAMPFGMTFWTPQTGQPDNGWIYSYQQSSITAFKATHQPSPWIGDYGDFSLMPMVGNPETDWQKRASLFTRDHEISKPYYYSVLLDKYQTRVEMTATTRCGYMRFTFPKTEQALLLVDSHPKDAWLKLLPQENKVIGYTRANNGGVPKNFACYFVMVFDQPFTSVGLYHDNQLEATVLTCQAEQVSAFLSFKAQQPVTVRIATSFISVEQAERNLTGEIGSRSFDAVCSTAKEIWEKELGRIEIQGASKDQQITFYTALYRALLFPRIWYEYNSSGEKYHFSPYDGKIYPGEMYADNGFWDTFRAVYPFFTIMYPERDAEIIRGWINAYQEGGWFPKWTSPGYRDCMIGTHVESLVADAWCKGIRDFDVQTAYQAMIKDGSQPTDWGGYGRMGLPEYQKLGYVACDKTKEATARTLEFAYDDFCIAQMARTLHKDADAQYYANRSLNYLNVWDPAVGFMRGRKADGTWRPHFDPFEWGDPFTEGSSWHYTWSVMQDIRGLINIMGGRDAFCAKLDSIFSLPPKFSVGHYGREIHEMTEMVACKMGQYAHGNQPVHHVLYLYNYAGQPWKTQKWVRHACTTLYGPGPDGLCGDEDNGQMSVWYLFSTMGFYPVTPGTPAYVIGSPLFKQVVLHLSNGKEFTIVAENNSADHLYIQSMSLNGAPLEKMWISHSDIIKGGVMRFTMDREPNRQLGHEPQAAPWSLSDELDSQQSK